MKLLGKLFLILFILLAVVFSIVFVIGFTYYSKVLDEKPLITRIDEVTADEHFVTYDNLTKYYVNAVIAVEDHRYYDHGAIDILGICRAIWSNIRAGSLEEGGSTITQQVSKNIIFNQDKTFIRKLGEIFGAFDLEKNYSKEEILALYVNTAYFGDGYYGIYDASMGYYGKEPKDLNLDEASMLAGVPNAPSVYAPTVNLDLANKRQAHVLNAMVEYGYISQEQADEIIDNKKPQ